MNHQKKTSLIAQVFSLMTLLIIGNGPYTEPAEPANSRPNPYRAVHGWAKLPEGRTWGSTAGIDVDPDGRHIWAIDRCGGNSCAASNLDPILKFDPSGNLVTAFGAGLFNFPHGIHVDREGNVWVTDARGPDGSNHDLEGKGHVVIKLSPHGEVLMTLGTPGVAGNGPYSFNQPCDVVTVPNGDIFVADGHSGQNRDAPANTTARIVKYSKDGTFIKAWGRLGSGTGEFRTPHALAIDPLGRLVVGDRGNDRLQMFDLEGNFIKQWANYSRPSGLHFGPNGLIYVADSESNRPANDHWGWEVGIRIGHLEDSSVVALIGGSNPEGVAVDAAGNVYGAVVSYGGNLVKHEKLERTDLLNQKPQ